MKFAHGCLFVPFNVFTNSDQLFLFRFREKSTQLHLKNVYSSLAIAMLAAAAGSYVHIFTGFIQVSVSTILRRKGITESTTGKGLLEDYWRSLQWMVCLVSEMKHHESSSFLHVSPLKPTKLPLLDGGKGLGVKVE